MTLRLRPLHSLLILFALLLAACTGTSADASEMAPEQGALAPEFELKGVNGERVRLSDYQGQVVLVNFWTTWCPPCRLEMQFFQVRYEQHSADFMVLAVDYGELAADVQTFAQRQGLTFPTLLDLDGKVSALYRVRGFPTSFLVDRQGVIQVVHLGGMDEEQLDDYLAQMGVAQ